MGKVRTSSPNHEPLETKSAQASVGERRRFKPIGLASQCPNIFPHRAGFVIQGLFRVLEGSKSRLQDIGCKNSASARVYMQLADSAAQPEP